MNPFFSGSSQFPQEFKRLFSSLNKDPSEYEKQLFELLHNPTNTKILNVLKSWLEKRPDVVEQSDCLRGLKRAVDLKEEKDPGVQGGGNQRIISLNPLHVNLDRFIPESIDKWPPEFMKMIPNYLEIGVLQQQDLEEKINKWIRIVNKEEFQDPGSKIYEQTNLLLHGIGDNIACLPIIAERKVEPLEYAIKESKEKVALELIKRDDFINQTERCVVLFQLACANKLPKVACAIIELIAKKDILEALYQIVVQRSNAQQTKEVGDEQSDYSEKITSELEKVIAPFINRSVDNDGNTPLHLASQRGDIYLIEMLLRMDKKSIEAKNANEETPLLAACKKGNEEAFNMLLKYNADIKAKKYGKYTPLHLAAESGNTNLIKMILKMDKESIEAKNAYEETPLLTACKKGNEEAVKALLEHDANSNAINHEGNTLLHLASQSGNQSLIKYLFERDKESIEAKNPNQETPLLFACKTGQEEVVQELLKYGADINTKDHKGNTPFHLAVESGNERLINILFKTGKIKIDSINKEGKTPLHLACEKGQEKVVRELLDCKANIYATDYKGNTPLHEACRSGNARLIKIFCDENNENINKKNEDGETPLLLACKTRQEEVVKELLKYKFDVNVIDFYGNTPLGKALQIDNNQNIIFALLTHGVKKSFIANNYQQLKPLFTNLFFQYGHTKNFTDPNETKTLKEYENLLLSRLTSEEFKEEKGNPLIFSALLNNQAIADAIVKKYPTEEIVSFNEGLTKTLKSANEKLLLSSAFKNGNDDLLLLLIDKNPELITSLSEGRNSFLHLACSQGNERLVVALLSKGASISQPNETGDTPLHLASKSGNERLIKILFEAYKGNINARNNAGKTPLHLACEKGDEQVISFLLDCGADINATDYGKNTPISLALQAQNRQDAVVTLMKHGVDRAILDLHYQQLKPLFANLFAQYGFTQKLPDPNEADTLENYERLLLSLLMSKDPKEEGCNPLFFSALLKSSAISDPIVKKYPTNDIVSWNAGLTKTLQSANEKLLLSSACRNGHNDLALFLIDKNPKLLKSPNEEGNTPLHLACLGGNKLLISILLTRGVDVNQRNRTGNTPLHLACEKGYEDTVEELLKHNANPNIKGSDSNTPLHLASQSGNEHLVEIILAMNKTNIDAVNNGGKTPLHLACEKGNEQVVVSLLKRGASVNGEDFAGNTPISLALQAQNPQNTVAVLMNHGINRDTLNLHYQELKPLFANIFAQYGYTKDLPDPNQAETLEDYEVLLLSYLASKQPEDDKNNPLIFSALLNSQFIADEITAKYPLDEILIKNAQLEKPLQRINESLFFSVDSKHFKLGNSSSATIPEVPDVALDALKTKFDEINFSDPQAPYYRDPAKLTDEGKPTTPQELKAGLKALLDHIFDKDPYLGTPKEPEKLAAFYVRFEKLLKHITFYIGKMDPDERATALIDVAIMGRHCGGKIGEAYSMYRVLSNLPPEALPDRIGFKLQELRLGIIMDWSIKHDKPMQTHAYNQYMYLIGKTLNLPNADDFTSEDPIHNVPLSQEEALQKFYREYTPTKNLDTLEEIFLSYANGGGESASLLSQWFQENVPIEWKTDVDYPKITERAVELKNEGKGLKEISTTINQEYKVSLNLEDDSEIKDLATVVEKARGLAYCDQEVFKFDDDYTKITNIGRYALTYAAERLGIITCREPKGESTV